MNLIDQYINDDCFNILPKMKGNSIDLIFSGIPDMSQVNGKPDIVAYGELIGKSCSEFSRVVKDKGFVLMMQTDRKLNGTIYPKQDIIKVCMRMAGMKLYQHKIYVKNKIDKKNLYQLNYANILIFTRNGKIKQSKVSKFLQDVFVYEYDSFGTFDPLFVYLILDVFTKENDIVLDPFAGRGTVCVCAKESKRKYIGIEYDKKIYNENKSRFSGGLNNFEETNG